MKLMVCPFTVRLSDDVIAPGRRFAKVVEPVVGVPTCTAADVVVVVTEFDAVMPSAVRDVLAGCTTDVPPDTVSTNWPEPFKDQTPLPLSARLAAFRKSCTVAVDRSIVVFDVADITWVPDVEAKFTVPTLKPIVSVEITPMSDSFVEVVIGDVGPESVEVPVSVARVKVPAPSKFEAVTALPLASVIAFEVTLAFCE